ncbi:MAG: glutamate synthase, partial [Deltaproteobacteria bacterium]|nr:glutamate synthase [Deltaproteobacteria bacterium]
KLGGLTLKLPDLFTGFDAAPGDVKGALAKSLEEAGCGYLGREPLGAASWFQLLASGDKPSNAAAALCYVLGKKFREPELPKRKKGQPVGLSVAAPALKKAIPFALERELDFLVLDATAGIEKPWVELGGAPDLSVLRDAIKILRGMNREEDIALVYFGGLRSGTDVAKVVAMNANAGVFGVAMGLALGASIEQGTLAFGSGRPAEELKRAAGNWIKGTVQETAIIARCTGKTNVHNLEPEDMRTITLATQQALGIPLASGGGAREYF